jgi:hypothetical protein
MSFNCLNLNYYGIKEVFYVGFKSYLYNRKQRVELKSSKTQNVCSCWEIFKHGVPQSWVLGYLLFSLYINDFPLQINSLAEVITFATDTSILVSHNNDNDFMKVFTLVLLHVSKWFQANWLILNVEKTSIIRHTLTKFSNYPLNIAYADPFS